MRELTLTPGVEGPELDHAARHHPARAQGRVARGRPDHDAVGAGVRVPHVPLRRRRVRRRRPDRRRPSRAAGPSSRRTVRDPRAAIEEARREVGESAAPAEQGASGAAERSSRRRHREHGGLRLDALLPRRETRSSTCAARPSASTRTTCAARVLAGLLDIFELQTDAAMRDEVVGDLDALMLHLLAGRHFSTRRVPAARGSARCSSARRSSRPSMRERARAASPDRLSDPARSRSCCRRSTRRETLPPQEDLEELFAQLRPSALGTVFAWLGCDAEREAASRCSRPRRSGSPQSNTGELVKLIASADAAVALEAIRRAGALKTAGGRAGARQGAGRTGRATVRLAAVDGARGDRVARRDAGAREGARRRRPRRARGGRQGARAARVPAGAPEGRRGRQGEARFATRTSRRRWRSSSPTACSAATAAWRGSTSCSTPKGGLFSRKEDPELRACAAIALGRIGTAALAGRAPEGAGREGRRRAQRGEPRAPGGAA